MGRINYPKFQVVDANGDPVTGGKLYTYKAGTSTAKATYSDYDLATPHANPVVLDSLGENEIHGNGYFKLVLKDSDDVEIWTIDNFLAGDELNWVSIADYDDSLNDAVSDIGATPTTLVIDKVVAIGSNVTVPATLHLLVLNVTGGALQPAGGVTATYNCPITAGSYPIFGGAGTNTISGIVGPILGKWTSGGDDDLKVGSVIVIDEARLMLPRGYLAGLELSNDTDADHDINIAIGECKDAGNTRNLILGTTITKQIDATWAAGDDAGGLFTGSVANTTWYHVFLIRKDSDASIDAGFDTSITAANIAAGYTEYRRIGSVLTDGSANIIASIQVGDEFRWTDPPLDVDVTNLSTTEVAYALSVPPDIQVKALMNVYVTDGDFSMVNVHTPAVTDEAPSESAGPLFNASTGGAGKRISHQLEILTNTAKQIEARAGDAIDNFRIATIGWQDRRGKDD